jgi:hypothetical protein
MITENVSTLKIHKLTKAQYERELEAGRIDENALYLTPDEEVDMSLYATVEQLNGKADEEHSHAISEVDELQSTLDEIENSISEKANTSHSHAISDVTNLQTTLDGINGSISGKADSEHSHAISDITDLETTLENNLNEAKSYTDTEIDNHTHDDRYCSKEEIENLELITVDDIDTICGSTIQVASLSEVMF